MNRTPLDQIVWDWGCRCFGAEHMLNKKVRALRMVEEAIETAQAVGLPREDIHALTKSVYARERGNISQELGGVAVTYRMLSVCIGHDPDDIYLREVQRVLEKNPEHFAARNREKQMVE